MKVCIGITTHNRDEVLSKAIKLALEQDYENKEVFVVDDASNDSTPQLRKEFPTVRWHRFDINQGYRNVRNFLMQNTDAEVFCSLDDDSWFQHPGAISTALECFRNDTSLAALGFEILDQGNPAAATSKVCTLPASRFVGCGHMLRLEHVRKVGFYHPLPTSYGSEEIDLCLRLLDAGFDVQLLKGVTVWHDKTLIARNVASQHSAAVCNDLGVAFTRFPMKHLLIHLPIKVFNHTMFGIRFALKRNLRRTKFDSEVVNSCGRFAFLFSGMRGVLQFLTVLPLAVSLRAPVGEGTFLEFRRRSH